MRRRGLAKVNCGVKSSVVPHARWLFASILAALRDEGELVFVEAARPMVRHNPFGRIAGGGGVGEYPKKAMHLPGPVQATAPSRGVARV